MENSQPLATESFSYSWLTNKGLEYDRLDQETKSMVFESKRFLGEAHNFNFDVPSNKSSTPALVDADEIFSGGQIIPLYPIPAAAVSSTDAESSFPSDHRNRYSRLLEKWRKSSKRLVQKCLRFLGSRKSIRVAADIDRRGVGDQDQILLQRTCNCTGVPSDFDSSISEAVLHCKRSISMLS